MDLLQNLKVKVFLQNTIFTVFSWVNKYLPHDKQMILFYINVDFRENNKSLFDYLIENGYNERYHIVCSCNNPQDYCKIHIDNVRFTNRVGGVKAFFKAGSVFYCIGKIPIKPGKNQSVMQMWHGTPLKKVNKNNEWKKQYYTWLLSTSRHFAPIFSEQFFVPEERIFIGGYPRCDALFLGNPRYDFGEYSKILLWAPTFRKSNDAGLHEFENDTTIIPILKPEDYVAFDAFLASINMKVVVKLHPSQYIDKQYLPEMSHFIFLPHADFIAKKMDLYRFLVQCDGLVTDYSSVYFDYLLLDRPIAFTEDDVEDYDSIRGFAVEDPDSYKPGFRIKTKEDLMRFCEDLANGKDEYKEERKRVNELSNDYRDGGFCQRILERMGITK